MKNQTASSLVMIHADLLKKLHSLSGWLTEGQTVPKDHQKGLVPSNYQPITGLSTTWMLLSGIIAAKMNRHMAQDVYVYIVCVCVYTTAPFLSCNGNIFLYEVLGV